MNNCSSLNACLLLTALLLLPAAQAQAQTLSKPDFTAGKARVNATYKADKAACAALAGNAKDICVEEAKAKEKVARADLAYGYSGKVGDRNKVLVAKADSAYAVARERCDDLAGNPKDVCVKQAKATKVSALADAKMGKEIGEARRDAASDKLDADYKVAVEKCEALAGDAKTRCITAAKTSHGKT